MTAPASKLLQPITVGPLELKNRIMFPPLTTGYEERDGSIGERSLAFYERLARGGVSYIVIGDVAPVMTASPTPKLATDAQIPTFKALADAVHKHGAKVALQLFHPEYDVPGVGRMVMGSMAAAKAAQEAKAAGDEETFAAKMAESNEIRNQAYAKLHHDMQHFVNEASVESSPRSRRPSPPRPPARSRPALTPSRSTATAWWVRCARPSSTSAPTSTVVRSRTAFATRWRSSPPLRRPRRS